MDPLPVLYVEDNAVNALIMSALFEHRPGMRLVVAGSVAEALAQARGLHPVLLMLDLRLPDGDGRQLLPQLRNIPGCETAPAVAVTAEYDVELTDTGFAELWEKPLDFQVVLRKLDTLLDARQGVAAHHRQLPVEAGLAWFRQPPAGHPRHVS